MLFTLNKDPNKPYQTGWELPTILHNRVEESFIFKIVVEPHHIGTITPTNLAKQGNFHRKVLITIRLGDDLYQNNIWKGRDYSLESRRIATTRSDQYYIPWRLLRHQSQNGDKGGRERKPCYVKQKMQEKIQATQFLLSSLQFSTIQRSPLRINSLRSTSPPSFLPQFQPLCPSHSIYQIFSYGVGAIQVPPRSIPMPILCYSDNPWWALERRARWEV